MKTEKGWFRRSSLHALVVVAGLLGAQAAFAQTVGVGGTIRLNDGPGSGPGGEFTATVLSGGSGSFQTFCLERNEYFHYNETLQVRSITTGAMNGGVSGGVGGSDPLDSRTAYLYTKFRGGTLGGYDAGSSADANSLQNAIWFIEGEINSAGWNLSTTQATQAQAWVNQANAAVAPGGGWSGLGNVQVLNLYRGANFGTHAQDQLYITPVPEPETYVMLLAGLGLMGFVARRRQKGLVA